jgi:hypothetical protein
MFLQDIGFFQCYKLMIKELALYFIKQKVVTLLYDFEQILQVLIALFVMRFPKLINFCI